MKKKKIFLKAEDILSYLKGNEELDNMITCENSKYHLITSDQRLYEALGSIKDREKININKLVKLLEVTDVISYTKNMKKPRKRLTHKKVEYIRKKVKDDNHITNKSS